MTAESGGDKLQARQEFDCGFVGSIVENHHGNKPRGEKNTYARATVHGLKLWFFQYPAGEDGNILEKGIEVRKMQSAEVASLP